MMRSNSLTLDNSKQKTPSWGIAGDDKNPPEVLIFKSMVAGDNKNPPEVLIFKSMVAGDNKNPPEVLIWR